MTRDVQTPLTIAQAWSAPIVMCLVGVGYAIWGIWVHPDSNDVTAALIAMLVVPATVTALVARGMVGVYQGAVWRGSLAIVGGVLLFAGFVWTIEAIPWRGDSAAQW
jgi:hypothetical protein